MIFDLSNLEHFSISYELFLHVFQLQKEKPKSLGGRPPTRPGRAQGREATRSGRPCGRPRLGARTGTLPSQPAFGPAQAGAQPVEHARVAVNATTGVADTVTARWPAARAHGTAREGTRGSGEGGIPSGASRERWWRRYGPQRSPGGAPTTSCGGGNGSAYGARTNGRERDSRKGSRRTGGSPGALFHARRGRRWSEDGGGVAVSLGRRRGRKTAARAILGAPLRFLGRGVSRHRGGAIGGRRSARRALHRRRRAAAGR